VRKYGKDVEYAVMQACLTSWEANLTERGCTRDIHIPSLDVLGHSHVSTKKDTRYSSLAGKSQVSEIDQRCLETSDVSRYRQALPWTLDEPVSSISLLNRRPNAMTR